MLSLDILMEKVLNNDALMIVAICLAGVIGYKIVSKLLKVISSVLFIVYMLVKISILN